MLCEVIDIAIQFDGFAYQIVRLNKNVDYIFGAPKQVRTRYLPPYPAPLVTVDSIRGWLSGALALDAARNPATQHTRCQGTLACFELLQLGHCPLRLSNALRRIQHPKFKCTALYLAKLMKSLAAMHLRREQLPMVCWELIRPWWAVDQCRAMLPLAV